MMRNINATVCCSYKSRELKENVTFIKDRKEILVLLNESDLLFCELTLKSWPIWCFPKTQLYLRGGKIELRRKLNVEWPYMLILMHVWNGNISNFAILSYILILWLVCSQQWLFPAVVICSRGSLVFCRWPHKYSQSWLAFFFLLHLTCSSPDVAFHVPPWRSACGPGPVALSRDTLAANQDTGKAMNHSGESHGHNRLAIH